MMNLASLQIHWRSAPWQIRPSTRAGKRIPRLVPGKAPHDKAKSGSRTEISRPKS